MRAGVIAVIAGCAFSPAQLDDAHHAPDAAGSKHDASVDAPLDAPKVCPGTYTFHNTTGDYRFTVAGTWQQAEADCVSDGNHLAKIEGSDEDAYLFANLMGSGFYWIGLYDPQSKDAYEWSDGTPLADYTNFGSNGSASGSQDCVDESFASGTWATWFCDPQSQSFPLQVGVCECDP